MIVIILNPMLKNRSEPVDLNQPVLIHHHGFIISVFLRRYEYVSIGKLALKILFSQPGDILKVMAISRVIAFGIRNSCHAFPNNLRDNQFCLSPENAFLCFSF
jgi:hypothetical protein